MLMRGVSKIIHGLHSVGVFCLLTVGTRRQNRCWRVLAGFHGLRLVVGILNLRLSCYALRAVVLLMRFAKETPGFGLQVASP